MAHIRLNKFLAQAGVASRREADRMIEDGRVAVNGEIIQTLGRKIDEEKDKVEVDGITVKQETKHYYLMLNKPPGYLVSLKDSYGRPTVRDLLPTLKGHVFPVGRLDFDSEGLLLLTNDGELTYRLTHPKFKIKKVYLVRVKGMPESSDLRRLERGIFLDGHKTARAQISLLSSSHRESVLRVVIHEGRKREIRRLFDVIGHRVIELQRIEFGSLSLGKLRKGKWRYLTFSEIGRLRDKVRLE